MYFDDLPSNIKKVIHELPSDDAFQARYGTDEKLAQLNAVRFSSSRLLLEWVCFNGLPIRMGGHEWKPITLEQICFLYAVENPIIKTLEDREITDVDVAVFCYVTQSPDFTKRDIDTFAIKAGAWWKKAGISIEEATFAINQLMSLAFQPLDFFPPTASEQVVGKKEIYFDSDWASSMISVVHQMTGLLPNEILKMPVAACGWYNVQYAKHQGVKNIGRKSESAIILEMFNRSDEIITDYLIEKGLVKEEDRDYYIECLKSPSKRKPGFKVRDENKNVNNTEA